MRLDIDVSLTCKVEQSVDLILQIRAPDFADQRVLSEPYEIGLVPERMGVAAEAGLGKRTLLRMS